MRQYLRPSLIAFSITSLYLLYLSCIAQPIIVYDSISYIDLARTMDAQGFVGYLSPGPQREPLYPLFLAMAMRVGNYVHVDYVLVIKWLQVICLMATQVLMYVFLKQLNVRRWLTAMAILAIGLMPSVVNSCFWIYSEILTYPLIICLMMLSVRLWESPSGRKCLFWGICCALLTFVKAVFILIVPLLMALFLIRMCFNQAMRRKIVVFISIILMAYYIPIEAYKWVNYKIHGNFVFTNRGPWALYGYTKRRLVPLNIDRAVAMLAYIPGPEFCSKVIPVDHCAWWSIYPADAMGMEVLERLYEQHLTGQQIDQRLMRMSFEEIKLHPFQYIALTYVESFKSLFWFNDHDSQVVYPSWVEAMYDNHIVFMILSFMAALGTLAIYLWTGWRVIRSWSSGRCLDIGIYVFLFVFANVYVASYALVQVTPRYMLPLVPVFLVMMALWANCLITSSQAMKKLDNR